MVKTPGFAGRDRGAAPQMSPRNSENFFLFVLDTDFAAGSTESTEKLPRNWGWGVPVDYGIYSLWEPLRSPKSGSAQSPIPIHSRQTVRSAAMITRPRKRPTNPNDVSPPRIPISASRKGSRVVPPMSAG